MALLEIRDLYKRYGHGPRALPAVRGIDLEVDRGRTVALVGESGCGKSSTGRVVAGLTEPSSGTVRLDGQQLRDAVRVRSGRKRVQMVSQHPDQSLNRHYRIGTTLREPLQLLRVANGKEAHDRVSEILDNVGLSQEYRSRRPQELSQGQQQRVAIARALVCDPDLIVLDEPTASLDQSVRNRIVALLRRLQQERDVAYLFISHDLTTVRQIADRVAVMYLGRIVEIADTEEIFENPQHPYTQALLASAPVLDPRKRGSRSRLGGETPSHDNLPVGCSFQDRCPLVHDRCRVSPPELEPSPNGALVECFAVETAIREGEPH